MKGQVLSITKIKQKTKFRYFIKFYEKIEQHVSFESSIPIQTHNTLDFESLGDLEREFGEDFHNAFDIEEEFWYYMKDKTDGDIEIATISKEEL